jgi:hypothetical protein
VGLQVPATALRALAADSTTPADWAGVIADLARQLDHDTGNENPFTANTDRRGPGAALRRYLDIRDRYCVMIGCRALATPQTKTTPSTTPTAARPWRPTSATPAGMTIG